MTDLSTDEQVWEGSFPKYGVKLSYFDAFIERCGGQSVLSGLTTTDVCEKFVKSFTAQRRCSQCELLMAEEHPALAIATVFISHAWKYKFLDVVSALKHHFPGSEGESNRNIAIGEAEEVIVWFDLFSNNHHVAFELDYDWWKHTFMSAIRHMGRCVMVLSPWYDPVPLTRAWCLFELYSVFVTDARFEIAMSAYEQAAFVQAMTHNFGTMNKVYAKLDVRNSESSLPQDKQRIFSLVQQSVGFDALNAMVCKKLREWVVSVAESQLVKLSNDVSTSFSTINKLKAGLANLHHNHGNFLRAKELFQQCYEARLERLGQSHSETLWAMHSLANVHWSLRETENALKLHNACLELRRNTLGNQHRDTLWSLNNLGNVYMGVKQYKEARLLYEECLKGRTALFGETHNETVSCRSNLALVYCSLYSEAHPEIHHQSSLHRKTSVYTKSKEEVSEADQRMLQEAKIMLDECLVSRRAQLGPRNPVTLWSVFNLANALHLLGDLNGALELHVECLYERKHLLGRKNPATLASLFALGKLYLLLAQQQPMKQDDNPPALKGDMYHVDNISLTDTEHSELDGAKTRLGNTDYTNDRTTNSRYGNQNSSDTAFTILVQSSFPVDPTIFPPTGYLSASRPQEEYLTQATSLLMSYYKTCLQVHGLRHEHTVAALQSLLEAFAVAQDKRTQLLLLADYFLQNLSSQKGTGEEENEQKVDCETDIEPLTRGAAYDYKSSDRDTIRGNVDTLTDLLQSLTVSSLSSSTVVSSSASSVGETSTPTALAPTDRSSVWRLFHTQDTRTASIATSEESSYDYNTADGPMSLSRSLCVLRSFSTEASFNHHSTSRNSRGVSISSSNLNCHNDRNNSYKNNNNSDKYERKSRSENIGEFENHNIFWTLVPDWIQMLDSLLETAQTGDRYCVVSAELREIVKRSLHSWYDFYNGS